MHFNNKTIGFIVPNANTAIIFMFACGYCFASCKRGQKPHRRPALPPTAPSPKAEMVGGIQSRKSYGNKPTLEMWAIVLRTAKLNVLIKYELSTPSPPSWRSSLPS